jgi:hypothetical protein
MRVRSARAPAASPGTSTTDRSKERVRLERHRERARVAATAVADLELRTEHARLVGAAGEVRRRDEARDQVGKSGACDALGFHVLDVDRGTPARVGSFASPSS